MSRDEAVLQELSELMAQDIPGFSLEPKETSTKMKMIFIFVRLFNGEFLTRYVTSWYPKVYIPAAMRANAAWLWPVLAHEWVHLRAAKASNPFFHGFLYLFPASLAPLALLSLGAAGGNLWWLLNLAWLLLVLPLPAFFRMKEEWAAYRMTLFAEFWTTQSITNSTVSRISEQFVGSAYWFMWPFEQYIRRRLYHEVAEIRKGVYDDVSPYKQVRETIEHVWKTVP